MFIGLFFQNALVDHIGVCTDTNNYILPLGTNNLTLREAQTVKQKVGK